METCARALARSVGYVGAATVEYLYHLDSQTYCFLELNPRLQVEHPVTEWISGVNIPAAQLLIGMGVPLYNIPDIRALYGANPDAVGPVDLGDAARKAPQVCWWWCVERRVLRTVCWETCVERRVSRVLKTVCFLKCVSRVAHTLHQVVLRSATCCHVMVEHVLRHDPFCMCPMCQCVKCNAHSLSAFRVTWWRCASQLKMRWMGSSPQRGPSTKSVSAALLRSGGTFP